MVFFPVAEKKAKLKTCRKINVQESKRKVTQKTGLFTDALPRDFKIG